MQAYLEAITNICHWNIETLLLKRQTGTAKGLVTPYLYLSLFKGFSVIMGPRVGFQDVDKEDRTGTAAYI